MLTTVALLDTEKKLELQKEVFTNCRQYIVQYLNPNDIADHLISKHLIGENASQELGLPIKTAQEKNRTIVNELSIGGPDTLDKFCEILKKNSRTKHIADKLEKGTYVCIRYESISLLFLPFLSNNIFLYCAEYFAKSKVSYITQLMVTSHLVKHMYIP